jgi:hypothetical protein
MLLDLARTDYFRLFLPEWSFCICFLIYEKAYALILNNAPAAGALGAKGAPAAWIA